MAPFEVPPSGAGVNTVIVAESNPDRLLAGMFAVSVVLLTTVVPRATPFQRMTDPATKLVPVTVNVNPAAPNGALSGKIDVIEGTGYDTFPMPDRPTICGLPGDPSTMVTVPTLIPC